MKDQLRHVFANLGEFALLFGAVLTLFFHLVYHFLLSLGFCWA